MCTKKLIGFLAIIIVPLFAISQTDIATKLKKANKLFEMREIPKALLLFEKISTNLTYEKNLKEKIAANTGVGKCYLYTNQILEAKNILESTYQIATENLADTSLYLIDTKNFLSWVYGYLGDLNAELKMSLEIVEQYKRRNKTNQLDIADVYNTISLNFNLRGDHEKENYYINKAIGYIKAIDSTVDLTINEQLNITNIYSSYSVSCIATGDYENALIYADRTLAYYLGNFPTRREIAIPYFIKSKYYSEYEKNLDSAIYYIDKSLEQLEADFGDGFPQKKSNAWLSYSSSKARILKNAGEYEQAENTLNIIVEQWKEDLITNTNYNPSLIILYNEFGDNYFHLNQLDKSIKWYKTGLKVINEHNLEDHLAKFRLLIGIRKAYEKKDNWKLALSSQVEALSLFHFSFEKDDYLLLDKLIIDDQLLECGEETALFLSENAIKLAQEIGVSEYEIQERALNYFIKTINLQIQKKLYLFEIGINEGYKDESTNLYDGALKLVASLQNKYPQKNYSKIALWIIEMSKNNVLKEAVYIENLYNTLLTQADQVTRNVLRATVYEAKQNLNSANSNSFDELQKAKQAYKTFKDEIATRYPIPEQQKKVDILTISKIDSLLVAAKNTLTINYYQGENHLYYVTTYNGKITFYQKEIPASFISDIERVRSLFIYNNVANNNTENDYEWFNTVSKQWFNLLINDPIAANKNATHITIIPHRNIYSISFDYLIYDSAEDTKYLIEKFPISYHYSQFAPVKSSNLNSNQIPFGGFAPTNCVPLQAEDKLYKELTRSNNNWIPGIKKELEEISLLMKGDVFYDNIKNELTAASNNYSILHIASHAIADNSNPDLSRLFFCSNNSADKNVTLTVPELASMQFNTDMTVLSACNTGMGKLRQGEGLLSLMRVFLQTGSASVVSTLWEVSDEKTSTIMIDYYKVLRDGKTKSEALRQAKIKYLNEHTSKKDRMPFYWSGIVIYGDDSPLNASYFIEKPFYKKITFYSVIVPVLLLIGFLFYRRRASKS